MKKITIYNLIVAAAILICLVFIFNLAVSVFQNRDLDRVVSSELAKSKVTNKDLVGKVKRVYVEKRYWVSDSFSFDEFERRLRRSLEKAGFQLLSGLISSKESVINGKRQLREEASYLIAERSSNVPVFRLTLIRKVPYRPAPVTKAPVPISPPPAVKPAPPEKARPKVAIVLDDWGYTTKNLKNVLEIDKPITLSILPGLPYSALVANKAREHNFEVILHMPMEPKAKMRLELDTLYTTMSDDEIRAHLAKSLESVPYAKGISNHEGSKATENERLMRVVLGELKKRDLFFLDSLVTNESVCESLARQMKVKFAKRSVFLDNESDPAYIRKQFERLINLAVKNGDIVAIGHDRPNTIAVLKEMIPKFEENGIDLTYVSTLAR